MRLNMESSVFISFLLFANSLAHSNSQSDHQNSNGPLFGNVMRYFGESEPGYSLPSSGLFDDVDTNTQQVSMCLRNFEVSDGSIIRTKDSQALGAHYLNETDLGAKSRDECLKLCCKVPQCNVAVFEEKNSGSCYLFDCGSLEDFRCKFTSQSHYVSAILRHRDILQQHGAGSPEHSSSGDGGGGSIMGAHINTHSHNQHEDELSQLRGSDKTSGGVSTMGGAGIPAAVVSDGGGNLNGKNKQAGGGEVIRGSGGNGGGVSSSTLSPVGLSDGNTESSRCSRWQFECKSTGECIAIYNVCDQIYNCPDRSDESPEMHCAPVNAYSAVGVGGDASKQKGSSTAIVMRPQQQPQSQAQQLHHPQPPVLISGMPEKPITLSGSNSPGGSVVAEMKNQAPLRHSEEYPQASSKVQQNGNGGLLNIPRKNDQGLNIFSHKDGGIMDEAFANHPQQQAVHNNYGQFWKQSPNYDYGNGEAQSVNLYGQMPPPQYSNNGPPYGNGANYGNSPYQYSGYQNVAGSPQQPSSSQGMQLLPQGQSQYPLANNNNYNMLAPNNPQQGQTPQQLYYNNQQMHGNAIIAPINNQAVAQQSNVRNAGTSQISNPINPSIQQGAQQQATVTTTSKPKTGPQGVQPTGKNNKNSTSSNNNDSLLKIESEFIKSLKSQSLQGVSPEVQSEELTPHTAGAGAVFIFILGMGMSIVMVIIVGCRLRRVGRRQRGKNRLDPDYLVDGMYL